MAPPISAEPSTTLAAEMPGAHPVRPSPPVSAIDSHAHVFLRDLPMAAQRRHTPDYDAPLADYLALLDAHGVSHAVLVQPSFLGTDNRFLLDAIRARPQRLRGVAVTGKTRAAVLPQLPTVAEAGLPGYEVYEWNGMFVPTGTPAAVTERLSKELAAVLQDPEICKRLEATGAEVIGSTPSELDAFRRAELANWTKLAKDNKIQVE